MTKSTLTNAQFEAAMDAADAPTLAFFSLGTAIKLGLVADDVILLPSEYIVVDFVKKEIWASSEYPVNQP